MTKSTFPVSPSQASPMQLQFCSMQERSEYEDETSAGGEHHALHKGLEIWYGDSSWHISCMPGTTTKVSVLFQVLGS